jgi:hypothetical protein
VKHITRREFLGKHLMLFKKGYFFSSLMFGGNAAGVGATLGDI